MKIQLKITTWLTQTEILGLKICPQIWTKITQKQTTTENTNYIPSHFRGIQFIKPSTGRAMKFTLASSFLVNLRHINLTSLQDNSDISKLKPTLPKSTGSAGSRVILLWGLVKTWDCFAYCVPPPSAFLLPKASTFHRFCPNTPFGPPSKDVSISKGFLRRSSTIVPVWISVCRLRRLISVDKKWKKEISLLSQVLGKTNCYTWASLEHVSTFHNRGRKRFALI